MTIWCYFSVPEEKAPILPFCWSIGHNTSLGGNQSLLYATLKDSNGLSHYAFSYNLTGAWANESFTLLSGNPTEANVNTSITLLTDWNKTIGFKVYFNNTLGQWANSSTSYLFGIDEGCPHIVVGVPVLFVGALIIVFLIGFVFVLSRRKKNG